MASLRVAEMALARRTEVTRAEKRCPYCGTVDAHLPSKDKNDRQRCLCRAAACGRGFNILTGTPMARARKPEAWGQYLSHLARHRSGRQIGAAGIGVNHTTIWRWRHRFLKAAAQDQTAILSEVIEADETFVVRSCKDTVDGGRASHPRRAAAGLGRHQARPLGEQVPVLTVPTMRAGSLRSSCHRWPPSGRRWTAGLLPTRWSAPMAPRLT